MSDEANPSVLTVPQVEEAIRRVIDPELHYNIYDLGLVYDIKPRDDGEVDIEMTLTSPGCPYGPMIIHNTKEEVTNIGAKEVNIEIVWDPAWSLDRMTDEAKIELGIDL